MLRKIVGRVDILILFLILEEMLWIFHHWERYFLWVYCIMPLLHWDKFYLEKAMAPHSSTVAWKIPWMEEPGGLQSMGLLRVRHDWVTSLSLSTFMHWRRKWQPTPVFLPRESHGQRSLVGCSPWGRTESDTTEATWQQVLSMPTFWRGFFFFFLIINERWILSNTFSLKKS